MTRTVIGAILLINDKYIEWIKKHVREIFIIGSIFFVMSYMYVAVLKWHISLGKFEILDCVCGAIAVNTFVMLCVVFIIYANTDNVICSWLGKISYEIYLAHMLSINFLRKIIGIKDDTLMLILAITITIILASGLYYIKDKLKKFYK